MRTVKNVRNYLKIFDAIKNTICNITDDEIDYRIVSDESAETTIAKKIANSGITTKTALKIAGEIIRVSTATREIPKCEISITCKRIEKLIEYIDSEIDI